MAANLVSSEREQVNFIILARRTDRDWCLKWRLVCVGREHFLTFREREIAQSAPNWGTLSAFMLPFGPAAFGTPFGHKACSTFHQIGTFCVFVCVLHDSFNFILMTRANRTRPKLCAQCTRRPTLGLPLLQKEPLLMKWSAQRVHLFATCD